MAQKAITYKTTTSVAVKAQAITLGVTEVIRASKVTGFSYKDCYIEPATAAKDPMAEVLLCIESVLSTEKEAASVSV